MLLLISDNMTNLIDGEEYNFLYSNDRVPRIKYPEMFDLKEYINHRKTYINGLNSEFKILLKQILLHYLNILKGVYGADFFDHIPNIMYNLLLEFNIINKYEKPAVWIDLSPKKCYAQMIKSQKEYVCENAYIYTKIVRELNHYAIGSTLSVCRRTNPNPKMLKMLAAEVYINSKEWIYTSILDCIQYNFKDLVFAYYPYQTLRFYDILLMKFVFQYFLKRNDTVFPLFYSVCKCTFGLQNKKHVGRGSSKNLCVLCNAIKINQFKDFFFNENKGKTCFCID